MSTGESYQVPSIIAKSATLSVLLVDDHQDGADSLAELLRLLGYATHAVYGSSAALAAVAAERPDVFIADIGIPHLHGCELAGLVWAMCLPTPLMIAITGYADAQTRERCSMAGFDHFFAKPADPQDILTVLRDHAARLSRETDNGPA